jgi:hypothetical protein
VTARISRNHHFVPQFILRGFARPGKVHRIATVDLKLGTSFVRSVQRTAAVRDFNTLRLEDGGESDAAEKVLADIEYEASKVVHRIIDGGWIESDAERWRLGQLIALQIGRTPAAREEFDALSDQLIKLDMAAGGPKKMRDVLRKELQREPTDEEVDEHWASVRDFDEYVTRQPRERHVKNLLEITDYLTPGIVGIYSWAVTRWERRSLIISDTPVLLLPSPDQHVRDEPVGVFTAGTVWIPLHRHVALVLRNQGTYGQLADGVSLQPTVAGARNINAFQVHTAHRSFFHHPDDDLRSLLGPEFEIPGPRPPANFEDDHGTDLRARLRTMAEWHRDHPDRPHPMSNKNTDDEEVEWQAMYHADTGRLWRDGGTEKEPL